MQVNDFTCLRIHLRYDAIAIELGQISPAFEFEDAFVKRVAAPLPN